jgi:hypothetical protein
MPNKVTGATDFLTVAGVAGSETYQAPDTAPYQTADTDYIWFKTDVSQRTTTTAELIGYDFTRTIVKYANTAPYAIEAIMILKSDVDTSRMRDDFDLSIWWSNVLSEHGNLKGNRGAERSVWVEYNTEIDVYISGLTTPLSATQKANLNTFVSTLKTGLSITTLGDVFDTLWVLAGETKESSYRNIVKNAHHITSPSEPTWTIFEGVAGNGSDQYLDLNYNPHDDGDNFIQNDASMGVYSRTNVLSDNPDIGSVDGVIQVLIYSRMNYIVERFVGRLNSTANPSAVIANSDSRGLYIITRNGNTLASLSGYKNKTIHDSVFNNGNTNGVPDLNQYLCCANVDGVPLAFSARQISLAFFGKYIDTTMRDVIVDAFEAYMDANGKGVIS